jgi:hypothetical protein
MSDTARTRPVDPAQQRRDLEDAERRANAPHPRNYNDDANTEKIVSIEPDGIGPTSTGTFDPPEDRRRGSGSPTGAGGGEGGSDRPD